MIGIFWIPSRDLAQRDKWAIRATFRIVSSKGGETSSEDWMA